MKFQRIKNKMDKEKFVQRVLIMLMDTCGCSKEEAIDVLNECLKRIIK